MRILKEDSAAVVIDIQERLLPHMFDGEKMLRNCEKLIEGLKILSVPITVTQQYTKGLGPTQPSIMEMFTDFSFVEKSTFSCCGEPSFRENISLSGKKNFIICGIEAHVCVLQTCIDLIDDGFTPVIVEDCISSRKPEDKLIAIERMRQEGARITTLESILFELTRQAGSDIFKSISRLVK
ncbi:MAG: hydrolase [Bacteroidales bacterium]